MKGCDSCGVELARGRRTEGEKWSDSEMARKGQNTIERWRVEGLQVINKGRIRKSTNANINSDVFVTRKISLRSGGDDLFDCVQLRRVHHGLKDQIECRLYEGLAEQFDHD